MNARADLAPNITYTDSTSSQVSAFGYDPVTKTLGVKFRSGGGSTYHYFGVPPEVAEAMKTTESVDKFVGTELRGKYAYEKQPDQPGGIVFGLSQAQEPKYTTATASGRIVNRDTGKAIPDDEPVMIFRAQDKRAVPALWGYHDACVDLAHRAVIKARIADFERFAEAHPERTKEPDTAVALAAA